MWKVFYKYIHFSALYKQEDYKIALQHETNQFKKYVYGKILEGDRAKCQLFLK